MEIDLLRENNRYVNTIDPQIVILPPELQTSASSIHMGTALKLNSYASFGHVSWDHIASAGVTVVLASVTASITSEKGVDEHCKAATDESAIDYALGIKADFSAGVSAAINFLGTGVNTGAIPNPWFKDMCPGFMFCTNLYAKCYPCKFCINKVVNEYLNSITDWTQMHFRLSDVPILRGLVDPPKIMASRSAGLMNSTSSRAISRGRRGL